MSDHAEFLRRQKKNETKYQKQFFAWLEKTYKDTSKTVRAGKYKGPVINAAALEKIYVNLYSTIILQEANIQNDKLNAEIKTKIKAGFDPNQARDETGRWTDGDRASLKDFEDSIRNQSFETAGVYDEDGNLILKKDGDKNSIYFTEEELMLMRSNKDVVFTHNHPKGYSFSKADIILAYKNNLREMRAVSEGVDHVLVFKSENKPTYMLANGLSNAELSSLYDKAYKKAKKTTDKIFNAATIAETTDEFLENLNYTLYHETMINLSKDRKVKGYLEYKAIKK